MELKPYQQDIITDLDAYLKTVRQSRSLAEGFSVFWKNHRVTPLTPEEGKTIEPYKNNVPGTPHVCIKVPTAGGKTFIACNAVKTIFDNLPHNTTKTVVWLVPSTTILEQTIKQLSDHNHPYRQKINAHFGNRVAVYDKQALLQGIGFNAASVQEQLSIFVLSFDSLKTRSKTDRKAYEENSNLQSFAAQVGEEVTLMKVIRSLRPVLIVDESHNAESRLSVDTLNELRPCFILDLTATPRNNSNIISFVDVMALKKEHMVKLPAIVYNYHDKTEVIHSAIQIRKMLQAEAEEEKKQTGRYIRPIVLFQAETKSAKDGVTFARIKQQLMEFDIPEEEIKIKTSDVNELKGIDLTAEDCPVRYIITINALKEGWDCPFAYVLASLADRSSTVDVEQILGRVLRQPYVMSHRLKTLNLCYVLTSSSKFLNTLENIVKGLERAGFGRNDVKAIDYDDEIPETVHHVEAQSKPQLLRTDEGEMPADDWIIARKHTDVFEGDTAFITDVKEDARVVSERMEITLEENEQSKKIQLHPDLQRQANTYDLKQEFSAVAAEICLPQFYIRKPAGNIFDEQEQALSKENLLDGFNLAGCDASILFNNDYEAYSVDAFTGFQKLTEALRTALLPYLLPSSDMVYKIKSCTSRIMALMRPLAFIPEQEIKRYIYRLLDDYTQEQFDAFKEHEYSYAEQIRRKIVRLADAHIEKKFNEWLNSDMLFVKPNYTFARTIIPGLTAKSIAKSLYEKEAELNGFEELVINEVANLPNVVFWTKNIEKKQFKINGFINHYPDFIIKTHDRVILLETKGDDRDNSDSALKLKLGKAWAQKTGHPFSYFMVFNERHLPGAHTLSEFIVLLKTL